MLEGEDILVDAGRYTYVDGIDRYFLKSALSHNVPMVNAADYLVIKNSWNVHNTIPPMNMTAKQNGIYTYFQGGHAGYLTLEYGVFINRKIIAIASDIFVIMDEFFTEGEHKAEQYFHFNNLGSLKVSAQKKTIEYFGKKTTAKLWVLTEGADIKEKPAWISRNYNQIESASVIRITNSKKGFQTLFSVIAKDGWNVKALPVENYILRENFESSIAEGVKIEKEGIKYYVFFNHKDVANPHEIIGAEGLMGIGRVQVVRHVSSLIA